MMIKTWKGGRIGRIRAGGKNSKGGIQMQPAPTVWGPSTPLVLGPSMHGSTGAFKGV